MSLTKNKPLLLTILLIIGVTAVFWLGSRYPDLDEKALAGGETQLAAIGFDTLVDVPSNAAPLIQIPFNTINWLYTNWRGMTFGLLMGGLLLTLLPLLGRISFKSRFANSLMGMLIGSPLGVCVNCAAPIGEGLFVAGGRTEMALATIFSSPTLNVIVLTMVFALFPTYMAVTKIGLTLLFILVGIPLLTRWLPFPKYANLDAAQQTAMNPRPFDMPFSASGIGALPDAWGGAIVWVGRKFGHNLWYIIKTTVPLMILAGALGSALVTLLPLETLAGLLPGGSRMLIMLSMIGVAFIGVFLPVPIAFDVIVTAVLLQAGLPINYAMILLFTLGIFSIYPFFLIWRTISKIGALSLFLALAGLGVVGGLGAHQYQQWDSAQQQQLIMQRFSQVSQAPQKPAIDRTQQGQPPDELLPQLRQAALLPEPYFEQGNLSVSRLPFAPTSAPGEQQFSYTEGQSIGITEHDNFSIKKFALRFAETRGIASGDIHNDGWPDIVISSDAGLGLYANLQGVGYQQQQIDIPQLNNLYVGNVALIDMNNDGWLDLFFSTFREGSYLIYNQEGTFTANNMQLLPNQAAAILSNAPAFGDIDKNGELDIVMGNATVGNVRQQASLDAARNVWLRQIDQQFEIEPLPAIAGETLTTLLVDLNQDGWLDLIAGNEFRTSDAYYLNDGQGNFKMVSKQDGLIPYTGSTTMSLTSADIDNDLVPEIFLAQKAWERGDLSPQPPEVVCGDILDEDTRLNCISMLQFRDTFLQAKWPGSVFECQKLETAEKQNGCLALKLLTDAVVKQDQTLCQLLSNGWPTLADYCFLYFAPVTPPTPAQLANEIPQIVKRNILFVQDEAGTYQDRADAFGLQLGGWAWNSKFADLDNDEWQDLTIVTGFLPVSLRHSNYLFHNQQGTGFKNIATEAGLHSYLDTLAYTYTDMDNDGDLDIITVPAAGPIAVYINNSQVGYSIVFELRDYDGNSFGIGSKIVVHYADGRHQMREIQASGGYLSFDAPIAHFGLGDYEQIERVVVHWSTGERTELETTFTAGAKYVITRRKS